jgi:hypothetical protein
MMKMSSVFAVGARIGRAGLVAGFLSFGLYSIAWAADTLVGSGYPEVNFTVTASQGTLDLGTTGANPIGLTPTRVEVWALPAPYIGDPQQGLMILRWESSAGGSPPPSLPTAVPPSDGLYYLTVIAYSQSATPYADITDYPYQNHETCGRYAGSSDTRYCWYTRTGFVNLVGSLQCSGGQCNTTTALPGSIVPQTGLWAVSAEVNGRPGRGFAIELNHGILSLTLFGYETAGESGFWQATGALNGGSFSGNLNYYNNGTYLGGSARSATLAGVAGTVTIQFADGANGTIKLPGESAKAISKLSW